MSSNIIVFKPPETHAIKPTKTDREIQYEKFIETASIPVHHFSAFSEMDEIERIGDVHSTLPSILIKAILPFCIPIIRSVPEFTVKQKHVDIFKKESKKDDRMLEKYYSIPIQLEYPISVKFEYADIIPDPKNRITDLLIPVHETFQIIGVSIPRKIVKKIDKTFLNYMMELTPIDILSSGAYGLQEFQSDLYTQSRIDSLAPSGVAGGDPVYFTSDDDARKKIKIIHEYIRYVDTFYKNNLQMVYRYIQIPPFSTYISSKSLASNISNRVFYIQPPRFSIDPISTQIADLIHVNLGNTQYGANFIFDKFHVYDTVHRIMMLGDKHPSSKKIIHDMDLSIEHEKRMTDFRQLFFQQTLVFAKKKAIALGKFGIASLDELTPAQRKVVELEYDKMEQFYNSDTQHGNDFKAVNALYWAINNGRTELIKTRLDDLAAIIKIPDDLTDLKLTMLKNTSGIGLICPHTIAKARRMINPSQDEITKAGKTREFLISKFSLPMTDDGYFCRICGELIVDADEEEVLKFISGKRVSFVMEQDKLKSVIWKEVMHIITAYVRFKDSVNYKNIISSITNAMRPEMGTIEISLSKIKTNSKDNLNDLMRIYITIYAFAIIVHMINKNYGKITFSSRPGVVGKSDRNQRGRARDRESKYMDISPKDSDVPDESSPYITQAADGGGVAKPAQLRLQNIINNALFLILRVKNIEINNASSISIDSIKPILIKAYKWASTLQVDAPKDIVSAEEKDLDTILNDYIYKYASYVMDLNAHYKNKPKSKHSIKSVLGRDWPTIISDFNSNKSIYETINVSEKWGDTLEIRYKYGSFRNLIDYVREKAYNTNAVPYSDELATLDKKYAYVREIENQVYQAHKIQDRRPYTKIALQDNYMIKFNNFNPDKIKIENFYDNDGIKHKFDIYVNQTVDSHGAIVGNKIEYSKSDVIGWYKSNDIKKIAEYKSMVIVDLRCSICKTLLSHTKNTSVEKARDKLEDITVFYEYYESRCPMGELHDLHIDVNSSNKPKCSKCGITPDISLSHDKKFYEKYAKGYAKVVEEKLRLEKDIIQNIIEQPPARANPQKFPDWVINNAPMLEISRLFQTPYNVWINLGLFINQRFDQIAAVKINPSASASIESLKLSAMQLYNHYLHVVRIFYIVKHSDAITNPPYDLKQILSKNRVSGLRDKMGDIDPINRDKYMFYKEHAAPHIVTNYTLHTISTTILNMHKTLKAIDTPFADELVAYLINNIVESEKYTSDPDMTKFASAVITMNAIDLTDATATTNINDDGGDADVVDDIEEPEGALEDLGDAEPDDQFSIDELDIEADADENLLSNPMGF